MQKKCTSHRSACSNDKTGRELPYDESFGHGAHPVNNITWFDAQAYVQWLRHKTGKAYRLPTEAAAQAISAEGIFSAATRQLR